MKNGKNPDISDNSLCTGHASGRIGNSAWHSLCYRGRSQDQFFQAYHDQGQSRTLKITGLKKGQKITWKSSSPKLVTVSASGKLSAIRNESSNLSFHFQKLTDPYEILTQKDASELANDTLDMAVPYWADLLKGSGITLRSLGFSTTK